MRDFKYYSTRTKQWPIKDNFGTVFVYRAGSCVFNCAMADWPAHKDLYKNGYTIEKQHDRDAFEVARGDYHNEGNRLLAEFKHDLRAAHGLSNTFYDAKFEKAFNLAWSYGHDSGFQEVANYFDDLVDLFK